jgi:small subunit ribosomal protein S19e
LPTAFEVPANDFIERLAKHLKENVSEISPPGWAEFAKTGAHKERPPQDPDWWYTRCASLLRKLYVHGPVGVARLRVAYGGNHVHGNSPKHQIPAGGSAIREPFQQLQKADLVAIDGMKGRKLTKQGLTLLNKTAAEVAKELKARPSRGVPS